MSSQFIFNQYYIDLIKRIKGFAKKMRERDDADEQGEQHQPVELAFGHALLLVQWAPPLHAEVHQGHLQRGQQGDDGAAPSALLVGATEAAHREVTDVGDEKERRGGEARIPGPEDAPRDAAPQAAADQRDTHEQHPDLGAGPGDAVPGEAAGLLHQIREAAEPGDREGQIGEPGRRHVDVEDANAGLLRGVVR